jgi:hypothetical protein
MSTTDEVGYVRRVTENPAAVLLLALIDGKIAGSLLGTFDDWRGNLYRLVVSPEHRRQGIGRELVRQIEHVFRRWGVKRTTVLVEVDRPWATEFWSAVGYPRDDHIVRHVGVHAWSDLEGTSSHPYQRTRVVVLVSANAEWDPVKEALKPERLDRSPYGEFFTHAVENELVLFFYGGWGKPLRRAVVKEDESTGGDVGSAQALSHEGEDSGYLFARHVELLDDLVDAEILEVLDYRGHRQAGTAEHPGTTNPIGDALDRRTL